MRKKQQKQSRRGRKERKRNTGQGRAGERALAAGLRAPAVILLTFTSTPSCSFIIQELFRLYFLFKKLLTMTGCPHTIWFVFLYAFMQIEDGKLQLRKTGGCYSQEPRDHFSTSIFSSTWRTDHFTSIKNSTVIYLKMSLAWNFT